MDASTSGLGWLAGSNDENREEHLAWTEAAIIHGEGVVVQ